MFSLPASVVLDAFLCACAIFVGGYLLSTRLNTLKKKDSTILTGGLPDPDPLHDFDLETATTRNHLYVNKTVRWPYYQTMSHQPMHINDWIEIDKDLKWYIEQKTRVINEQGTLTSGKHVIDSLPENDAACGELLEILVDYLPKRYPTLFEKLASKSGQVGIWNKVTDDKFEKTNGLEGVDALKICSRLVEDDFLMAREREDGHVYFVGGLVAFPGFYLLSKKINKSLHDAHAPVPYFNQKLLVSVERTLKRFAPNEPFERTSWEIVDDRDLFFHNIATLEGGDAKLPDKLHPKDLFFRVDHQTFRKLPRTKGIIFGVHPIMKRLEDFADSPLVPALLAKIHEEGDRTLMDYKLAPLYQDRMLPYLRELTARQMEKGLIR
ncbi:uncharacterized protein FOMMEDRAFT_77964 [Fomitiporia mediterranea MF3/22]|uniref:uncharacterized protein n=1 Tax=Fomitiporia mediterranea (strain MF3/22) TaxID=694068 RepID=UPI0004407D75|nr:uncharacterized protein FOMMEDRAFT_77964 [Fomitiporia mediterranea MF3/22]EJD05609.1 hypothetical protein FOMMEDRAFT_77964 [Fomitiporia mediterranea MF3/22]